MAENTDNVLYLRDRHISTNINAENMDAIISPRRSDKCLWRLHNAGIHLRVRLCLARMGFYGVIQCGPIKYYDNHLLTAIVERWRRETHTFHLTVGEATITLQDVAIIWGLNIDGIPITGVDTAYNKHTLQQRCATWLGFTPTSSQIKGGHLYLTALLDHCVNNMVNDESTEEEVTQYSRCVALMIIGGCMFPDSEGAAVKLMYLQFLEDIELVNTYSWGSAVLAYLYRELCDTSMSLKGDLCGPVQILQIWVWSRIILLCPDRAEQVSISAEQAADVMQGLPFPPYGARWRRAFSWTHTAQHSVRIMRDMLDRMVEGQVDANYRQFIARPAHVHYPPMWTGNEFEPGPSSSNMAYTTPPVGSRLTSYDAGYYTPIVGSFTQFLQSDFRPGMNESRPTFNPSPIPFPQYSDPEGFEVGGNIEDTSTSAGQTSTHGDDEQMLGRGRRVIRRPPCGTGGHRYHRP